MNSANTWLDESLADPYAAHAGSLRGAVRQALVTRALLAHLPAPPQHVLDIGGGNGHQAIALASRGHQVTILDPDEAMLKRAADAWSAAAGTAPCPAARWSCSRAPARTQST